LAGAHSSLILAKLNTPHIAALYAKEGSMYKLICAIIFSLYLLPSQAIANSFSCGLKPLPNIGCKIGRCINGVWEQVCNSTPSMSCGLKPLPNIGCKIGRCVNGSWEQVCNSTPSMSCGLKPLPNIGCKIGRCVNGSWEQVCK